MSVDLGHEAPQIPTEKKPPLPVFIAATIVIFFLSLSAADSVGFVPDYLDETPQPVPVQEDGSRVALSNLPELGEEATHVTDVAEINPVRIQISAIDLDLEVQNPSTRDIAVLDGLLVNGPARYVDSARLGVAGNMIIFAHSSHLPIVHNQMFKAFNRVPELKPGDVITLVGDNGTSYLYSVTDLKQADAGDTTIDLSITLGTKLTLVTCDTLTGKSARFVLTADFIGIIKN